jgi:outer membrane protein OmpA-like peptidoglycan-associated protein/sporulation protein YlmC with PRC-barrel domain
MKIVFALLIILTTSNLAGQHVKIKTYYNNGKPESQGFVFAYEKYDKRIPKKYEYFKGLSQKDGKWKYWYPNGELKRVENYKVVSLVKKPIDIKDGIWSYYNDQGIKYREEFYTNNSLTGYVKEIYNGNGKFIGKVTLENGVLDTVLEIPTTEVNNLIVNPDFDLFYYKPVPVTYEGQTRIEDWIPFWVTPEDNTPDYISNLRIINLISYHYLVDFTLPEKFDFIGIALYKQSDLYSENIQGKLSQPLIKGQKYCLKTTLALSSYSGFTINRIGFHFSDYMVFGNLNSITPQIVFSDLPQQSSKFMVLCDDFTSNGNEEFITIGRFAPVDSIHINKRTGIPLSSFGLEKSAYYLIDKVELFPITYQSECDCTLKEKKETVIKTDSLQLDIVELTRGSSVILKNLNFEFNSYKLQPSSDKILYELLDYLTQNPDIKIDIMGHTDDIGSEPYNLTLSENRAKSVFQWLTDKGIAMERLTHKGFGKNQPLYQTDDLELKALNRRVEIKIQKKTK